MMEAYLLHLCILICIYVVLALSLQLSIGFSGLLNLGHIAFYCIGAYTSALLAFKGFPYLACLFFAGIMAAFFGFLISIPTHRLKGDYLALATMGFGFVVYALALNWKTLTRGPLGLPGIPKPIIFGVKLSNTFFFFVFVLIVALITYLVIRRITNSPFGKVLEAIRDDELAARILGKSSFRVKSCALSVSAFFAGLAGSLYAHYITYIDPSAFTLLELIPVLAIVILGGLGSLEGTIMAAILLTLLPEPLRLIGLQSSVVGPIRQLIFGLLLLLILIFYPKGIYGRVELE